jgi:hypothetical protein
VARLEYISLWGTGEAAIPKFLVHAHVVGGVDLVNTRFLPFALDLLLKTT